MSRKTAATRAAVKTGTGQEEVAQVDAADAEKVMYQSRIYVPDRKFWRDVQPGDHVWLIDGSGFIFRAYFALPPLTRRSDGLPVGAVHGFVAMLNKLLHHMRKDKRPTHIAVLFDATRETFRNEIYPQYKANRPEPPADLVPQFDLIRQATEAFGIALVEQEGYEADDLIATYAKQAAEKGAIVHIVSSDKDLMQLVDDERILLFDPMKEKDIGPEEVEKRFGVPPEKVVDVQALAGDSTDNIPGVPGIGVKTAAQLIKQYGSLENLLAHVDEIKQRKRRENLKEYAEAARISKQLVKLKDDVPVEVPLAAFAVHKPDPEKLIGFLKGLEFTTLASRIAKDLGVDPSKIPPLPVTAEGWQPPAAEKEEEAEADILSGRENRCTAAETARERLRGLPFTHAGYELITDGARLRAWLEEAREQGHVAFDVETTSLDAMQAEVVGVALALAPDRAAYVPLSHRQEDDLLGEGAETVAQIPLDEALALLKPLLEDEATLKIAHNIKYDAEVLKRQGIDVRPFDDTMLLSYVLEAGLGGHGLDELAKRHFEHRPIAYSDVAGKGKKQVTFDCVTPRRACEYAAEDADIALRLWLQLKPAVYDVGKSAIYETEERPLVPVLMEMEMTGVLVDTAALIRLGKELAARAQEIEKRIHELAGVAFNVGSTKQLAEVLFDRLGLTPPKKTATGARSTDNEVLEELAAGGLEAGPDADVPANVITGAQIAELVLQWRMLMKLKSTYCDALAQHVNPQTGRVHTSYSLAATTTGRLASTDPNLQNIPIRTEEGRKIRAAFIAPKGRKIISSDYSQIELRILAHVADVKRLQEAFRRGEDIHTRAAAEMFEVPPEQVDRELRRKAKVINYGIIYGISAFGLARRLGVSKREAANYMKLYFRRFPEVKTYMERTRAFARKHGYVETLFGRRIHVPGVNASNPSVRAYADRAAINAPMQGTAADIIRRAMVRMPEALQQAGLQGTLMLLQVHDELVFETPEEEVEQAIPVIRQVMEHAHLPVVDLKVPLIADPGVGDNWEEAH